MQERDHLNSIRNSGGQADIRSRGVVAPDVNYFKARL